MIDSPMKQRIAEALKTLLKQKSFSEIRVKGIVDVAGVSSMSFYRSFSDKYDLLESICYDDLMLFTKIYGSKAEVRSFTVCMLNTIQNHAAFYGKIFSDNEAIESFIRALSRVSEETTGTQGSAATLATCKETMRRWAADNFEMSVDDVYTEWVSTLPLRSVLKGEELAEAIRRFEANTIEDFRMRMNK